MQAVQDGFWYESKSENKPFFHAHLFPGHENSGKLVSTIIAAAHQSIENDPNTIILVDGPPGIGCPVISTCNQTDIAILVAEPTLSGIMMYCACWQTTSHFSYPLFLILNKADLNQENAVGTTQSFSSERHHFSRGDRFWIPCSHKRNSQLSPYKLCPSFLNPARRLEKYGII
jgi:MinD superfamily P-loop ATPase